MTEPDEHASVRCLVTDVEGAIAFYATHLGFTLNTSAAPAFADVVRGPLRLLLSGPASSGARATPVDAGPQPHPPGRRRPRRRDRPAAQRGLAFRSDLVAGPGGARC